MALEKPKLSIYQIAGNVEHNLFESLIVEYCDIAGFEVEYYVRDETTDDLDDLYGESLYQNTAFKPKKLTKVIYEVTEEPTITDGFGIHSEETIQYAFMPKHIFNRDVANPLGLNDPNGDHQPVPGDVIKTIWNDRAYTIVDVAEESHIFQANKSIWEFILKPFRFSEESFSASAISPFDRPPTENRTDIQTMTTPLSAYGNNEYIENQSDDIYDYANDGDLAPNDVDTSVYGY